MLSTWLTVIVEVRDFGMLLISPLMCEIGPDALSLIPTFGFAFVWCSVRLPLVTPTIFA